MMPHPLLDDPAKFSTLDPQDMLGTVTESPDFMAWCLKTYHREGGGRLSSMLHGLLPKDGVRGVFITGMGGSAISGDVIHDWLKSGIEVPVIVIRDYKLPSYISKGWLGFILSYSGNTEETLSVYIDAKERGIPCIGITSGGLLEQFLHQAGDVCLNVPPGHQPRAAFFYLFTTLAIAINTCKFPGLHDLVGEIEDTHRTLVDMSLRFNKSIPVTQNLAKQLAVRLHRTTIIVYGFDSYGAVARRFKGQFNENGKNPSYYDVFSELNHNETVGWEVDEKLVKSFSCIFIRDPARETKAIQTRIEFTKEIVERKAHTVIEVHPEGQALLSRMLSLVLVADFTSTYLAFLNGKDPTPVNYIQGLKDVLATHVNLQAQITRDFDRIMKQQRRG